MASLLERFKNEDQESPAPDFEDDFPAELRDEIMADPVPGKARGAKPAKPAPVRKPVTAAVRKRVTDELDAYVKMAALAWSIRDDHCGPVLNDQSRAIAEAIAELISRNPAMVAWVETSGVIGDWVKLWMAIAPVVSAVRQHHIVRRDQGEESPAAGGDGVDFSRYAAYRPSA